MLETLFKMKIRVILILGLLLLYKFSFAQGKRTEKTPLPTNKNMVRITQYYDNNQKYREFYEREGVRDSLYLRWNEQGKLVREGYYNNGKKLGIWKRWFFGEDEWNTNDYQEMDYNAKGFRSEIRWYDKREGKYKLQKQYSYTHKGDNLIEIRSCWSINPPYDKYKIDKSIKYKKKLTYNQLKEWSKNGYLSTERISKTKKDHWIILNKKWDK